MSDVWPSINGQPPKGVRGPVDDPSADPDPDYEPAPMDEADLHFHGLLPDDPKVGTVPVNALARAAEGSKPKAWPALDAPGIFAPLEPINYIIRGLDLCPGAPAMVAGYGFSGKTVALQSAALAIATGERVWGTYEAKRGRVLHVDYEQGQRLTRERYQRLALALSVGPSDIEDRLTLVSMPQIYLDGVSVEQLVKLFGGYDLVIIDSLRAACPTLEENDSSIRCVLDNLTRASEQTGCTVVVIHHARKPQQNSSGGPKMAIRGSGALFDACSSVLVFDAEKGGPTRVSHEKARNSGRLTEDFEIRISDLDDDADVAGLVVEASAAPDRAVAADAREVASRKARMGAVVEEVRAYMREAGEVRGGQGPIATKLGRKKADVGEALAVLVDSGEITQAGSTRDRSYTWAG